MESATTFQLAVVALLLSLFFTTNANTVTSSVTSKFVEVPVTYRPVTATKLYKFTNRQWYKHYLPLIPSNATILTNSATTAKIASSPIKGSITPLGEYFATLKFAGQPINVQLDTGSSTMAIPLSKCTNCLSNDHRLRLRMPDKSVVKCDSSVCRSNTCSKTACGACSLNSNACCSLELNQEGCAFRLTYADQSGVTGTLIKTDVTVGDTLTTELTYGGILTQNSFEANHVDGIFGLAFKTLACNPTCVLPLVDTMYSKRLIRHDIFSMCLSSKGGVLTLGGSDPKYYQGDLKYVPFSKTFNHLFYKIDISGWSIDGVKVALPMISNGIVDSGTTLLVVSTKTYDALKSFFQSHYCNVPGLCPSSHQLNPREQQRQKLSIIQHPYYPSTMQTTAKSTIKETSWFQPGYCVDLTSRQVDLLPSMAIHLNGFDLVISSSDYMIPLYVGKRLYHCLGISPLPGMEYMPNDVIIGDTILQKYFVEYDRENERIGFALAKDCSSTKSSLSTPSSRPNGGSSSGSEDGAGLSIKWIALIVFIFGVILLAANRCLNRSGYQSITSPAT